MKDNQLLGKYNEIWDKFSNTINKGFDNEPVYNEKYLNTKVKFCEGKMNTNFHCDSLPKEGFSCICLSASLIDSISKTGKSYYPEVF